jgi:hypothetical protein
MIRKADCWFWPKMSHVNRGDVTHTIVTPIKMTWLILGTERCGGTVWIDVPTDVHVKVSYTKGFSATLFKIMLSALAWLKRVRFKNNFFRFICRIFLIKGSRKKGKITKKIIYIIGGFHIPTYKYFCFSQPHVSNT